MYENDLSLFGDPDRYSRGLEMINGDRQIKRGLKNGKLTLQEIGKARAIVRENATGRWFLIAGGWNTPCPSIMLGAACGDVAGSVYEHKNIKYMPDQEKLIPHSGRITDDTVMTLAVADGIRLGLEKLGKNWIDREDAREILFREIQRSMRFFGRKYPDAGFGGGFRRWLKAENPQPYNSWGNGSAMRVSYAGWMANTLEEAETLAEISASVTHNHPEGIKGAKAVAGIIFLLRTGASKEEIRRYARQYYDLDFTLDSIRADYRFDVSCQGSVPQAIRAFLEGESFAQVLALAISIGGDSDTIGAIAGSMAEVIYPIPQGIRSRVIDRMDFFLQRVLAQTVDFAVDYRKDEW